MELRTIQQIHEIINKQGGLKYRPLGAVNAKLIREFNEKVESIPELAEFYKKRDEFTSKSVIRSVNDLTQEQKTELLTMLAKKIKCNLQFSFDESEPQFNKTVAAADYDVFYFLKQQ